MSGVELTIELPVVTFWSERRVACEHDVVSFKSLRLSWYLLILIRLYLIVLILVSAIVFVLLPLGKLLIVSSFFVLGVLPFLGPFGSILRVIAFLALIVLIHPVLVWATPVARRAVRHVSVVAIMGFLWVLRLELGWRILMPLIISILSPLLNLLRVVLIGLKLDVLLLLE